MSDADEAKERDPVPRDAGPLSGPSLRCPSLVVSAIYLGVR